MLPDFTPLLDLVRTAGAEVLRIYAAGPCAVEHKADNSPLTAADLASHHILCAGLAQIEPALPVVSEEDADSATRCSTGSYWLIDPLDGTKEFIARNGEFTINVALIRDGRPVCGVVYAPALDEMFWGGRGVGAWRRCPQGERAIAVAAPAGTARPVRVVASKSHLNAETMEFIARVGPSELVQAGSSLKLCRVAEGAADLYPRLGPTCEWDTAAAHAVVEGAGGHVTDLQGVSVRYGKADILNPHFVASCAPLGALVRLP
jgi:3'(2'), 5'-bisphosphate nucleotidase